MSSVTGARLLMLGGLLLAVVMFVLMRIGTYSMSLFVTWGVLGVAGVGLFALGRNLDRQQKARLTTSSQAGRSQQAEESQA